MATRSCVVYKMPGLGRSFELGYLYNAVTDKFTETNKRQREIPFNDTSENSSATFEDDDESEFSCAVIAKPTSFVLQADVLSFDQGVIVSKMSHIGLCSQHQQVTAAANLIENIRGAARYGLHDKISKYDDEPDTSQGVKTLRVRFSLLKSSSLQPEEVADFQKLANDSEGKTPHTHFVESIDYGVEAYCVFVNTLKDGDLKQEVEEVMESVLNKLVNAMTDGDEPEWLKDEINVNNWKGRFYGDLYPHPRDCTLIQAYELIRSMIDRVTNNPALAIPITISLHPIRKTDNLIFEKIDDPLLEECLTILNSMVGNVARIQTWLKHDNIKVFPDLRLSLRQFIDCLVGYIKLFRDKLNNSIIPDVRSGKASDKAIQSLLDIVSEGLFNPEKLTNWIETKESEIKTMLIIANMNKQENSVVLIQSETKLEETLLKLHVKSTLVLLLPPLKPDNDPYLTAMKKYIKSHRRIIPSKLEAKLLSDQTEDSAETAPWQTNDKAREELLVMAHRLLHQAITNREAGSEQAKSVEFLMASMDLFQGKRQVIAAGMLPYRPTLVLYREGKFCKSHFRLPSAPQNVQLNKDNSSLLEWSYGHSTDDVSNFVVELRKTGDASSGNNWMRFTTRTVDTYWEIPPRYVSLNEFSYEFRIAAVTEVGQSEFSPSFKVDNAIDVATEDAISSQSVNAVIATSSVYSHQQHHQPPYSKTGQIYSNRKLGRVSTLDITKQSRKIGRKEDLDLYAVPLIEITQSTSDQKKLRRMVFGQPSRARAGQGSAQHKTILVMGATGSGKTTLINCMINYIFGVEWKDSFRFVLIEENHGTTQADSQTSAITAYEIHHRDGFRIPYSLTVVDTPGYGDTQGLERDKDITENVRQFFQNKGGIQEVDAICFVSPASLPRLTPTQFYIFESVLSIFGKDIEDNIQYLLTFADGQKPPVLVAIKEAGLPCPVDQDGNPQHHKFNNSGFFAANKSTQGGFTYNFWQMGFDNFHSFFSRLSTLKTQSLSLTREVLDERKQLEVTLEGLQPMINQGLAKMDELRKTQQFIANNEAQIDANINVPFEVEVYVAKKIDISRSGQYLTNCQKCHKTCHYPCGIARDEDKKGCWAMDRASGNCRICDNKCVWSVHINQNFRWEYELEKQTSSSEALRQKYGQLNHKKLTAVELVAALKEELETNQTNVLELVNKAAICIRRLEKIALRPSSSSTLEHISMMIKSEEQEKRAGYKDRIRSLEKVRQLAELKEKIRQGKPIVDESLSSLVQNQVHQASGDDVRSVQEESDDNFLKEKFRNLFKTID